MSKIRVLLVENHPLLRHQIRRLLQISGNVEVMAEVSDTGEALKIIQEGKMDLVVMDLAIPGTKGMKDARRLKEAMPGIKMIVLSSIDNVEYQAAAVRNGIDGCVQKDHIASMLLPEIQRICGDGGTHRAEPTRSRQ